MSNKHIGNKKEQKEERRIINMQVLPLNELIFHFANLIIYKIIILWTSQYPCTRGRQLFTIYKISQFSKFLIQYCGIWLGLDI